MVRVTNEISDFFEKEQGSIVIYGSGHYGGFIGSYMERCKMDFDMYVDGYKGGKDSYIGNKMIGSIDNLKKYKGKALRIIISPLNYGEILFRLHKLDANDEYNILCLVPLVRSFEGSERYDINVFLGYFRKKLINREVPTIISNDCVAGMIYKCIGVDNFVITPTINTNISADDFLKIALNPEYYLKQDMKPAKLQLRTYAGGSEIEPSGCIDDIVVRFSHLKEVGKNDIEKCAKRWNYMKDNINWDRIVFIVRNHKGFPYNFVREMKKCRYPYRIIVHNTSSGIDMWDADKRILFNTRSFGDPNFPVEEDGFDFIGWYNDILDEIDAGVVV